MTVREELLFDFMIVVFVVFPELVLWLMVALIDFFALNNALMSVTGGATSMGGGLAKLVTSMGLCSLMGAP